MKPETSKPGLELRPIKITDVPIGSLVRFIKYKKDLKSLVPVCKTGQVYKVISVHNHNTRGIYIQVLTDVSARDADMGDSDTKLKETLYPGEFEIVEKKITKLNIQKSENPLESLRKKAPSKMPLIRKGNVIKFREGKDIVLGTVLKSTNTSVEIQVGESVIKRELPFKYLKVKKIVGD